MEKDIDGSVFEEGEILVNIHPQHLKIILRSKHEKTYLSDKDNLKYFDSFRAKASLS